MFPAPSDFYLVSLRQQEIRHEVGRIAPIRSIATPASPARPSRWVAARRGWHAAVRSLARVERRVIGVAMLAMVLLLEWRLARMSRA